MALVVVMTVITMLAIYVSEMLQNTSTAFQVAVAERDRLKAEYIAVSGINLTRLLIVNEPVINKAVAPFYGLAFNGRKPPQINIWDFAGELLSPFTNMDLAKDMGSAIDFDQMEGARGMGGTLEVVAVPENAKINIDKALFKGGDAARLNMADQLYALMGGMVPESPYDAVFERPDAEGQYSTRLDIISAVLDWWDEDQTRTVYEPRDVGGGAIANAGSEDDSYSQYRDPYQVKNTHFDSIEELRMVRGISDDFWATFIEPDPTDPKSRNITIYGSGAVNVNEAPPTVLHSRMCVFAPQQPLCMDPLQAQAFMTVLSMAKSMIPIPIFSNSKDFMDFVTGGGGENGAYQTLTGFTSMMPGGEAFMAWTPLQIPKDRQKDFRRAFITSAAIFTVQATGFVGRSEVRISSVVNTHRAWQPPPPNAGGLPKLGILHHYRIH